MKEDKKIIQQKIFEYQILQQHLETLQQQLQLLNQQDLELLKLKENLSQLENSKLGEEIFSQIGPGIYTKANLKETKEVLFNIGANILINKKIKDAIFSLESQQKELSQSSSELEGQFKKILPRVIELQQELQKLKK